MTQVRIRRMTMRAPPIEPMDGKEPGAYPLDTIRRARLMSQENYVTRPK
jgi:hypothetical protein